MSMKTSYFLKKSSALALFSMFALSFQSNAQKQATIDGIIYQIVEVESSENYAETVLPPKDGEKDVFYTAETIAIPAKVTIDGAEYSVKKIGNNSMRQNPNLKTITLPDGIETIGNSAFAGCLLLENIVLPVSVNSIEAWAFHECKALKQINIPDGISTIFEHTFQLSGLTSIELPTSLKKLVYCAFQDANDLASINLDNITEIGDWALYATAITSVDLSNVRIGNEAFRICPNLETVTLKNVFMIGNDGFRGCTNLKTIIFEDVFSIGNWAFEGCTKLTSANLGNVETIGVGSFSGCSALNSITIPSTTLLLDGWALEKTGITEIFASWEKPADMVDINKDAFGADEGKINFTWKVPEEVKAAWGNQYLGYPVEVGTPETANEFLKIEANVYYAAGTLYITNLSGYNTFVYSLDGRAVARFNVNTDSYNASVSLTPGIYVLKAVNGNKIATTKFAVR